MRILAMGLLAALGLSACNTVQGLGQDIQAGGAAIKDAAEEATRPPLQVQPAPGVQVQPAPQVQIQPAPQYQPAPAQPQYGTVYQEALPAPQPQYQQPQPQIQVPQPQPYIPGVTGG